MKKFFSRRLVKITFIVSFFIIVSSAVASIETDQLIAFIGEDKAWLVMFVLGMVGGVSTFVALPYQVVLMSFSAGGINPVILGIATATGIMIGDSLMFLIGQKAERAITQKQRKFINKAAHFFQKKPKLITPGLVLYGMFSPFSNDFVILLFSLLNYRYLKVIVPLAMGNIFYNIGLAYLGIYAYENIIGYFS